VGLRGADRGARGRDGVARPRSGLGAARGAALTTALAADYTPCHDCALLSRLPEHGAHGALCPRCGAALHERKPRSLERTWAWWIAAALCYLPANLLPIMKVTSLGRAQADTIMSGVAYLLLHGMWPLAVVVFTASVFVPLLKLAILLTLLISVHRASRWRPVDRTRLYRLTEAIGRWSMVDIFVVTILVALVRLGNLATVEAQTGAVFFGAVVVLTMLAAESFDPRLIWDRCEERQA
jgi:paraquat-inducible protein A